MQSLEKTSINHFSKSGLLKKIVVIAAVISLLYACKKKGDDTNSVDCSGTAKTFSTDANPVIQASCIASGCHGSGSNNGPGPLLNYSQIFNARSDIRSSVSSGHMPLNGSLTASQKAAIICWIDNGALNN
jgi:hypothetical protein